MSRKLHAMTKKRIMEKRRNEMGKKRSWERKQKKERERREMERKKRGAFLLSFLLISFRSRNLVKDGNFACLHLSNQLSTSVSSSFDPFRFLSCSSSFSSTPFLSHSVLSQCTNKVYVKSRTVFTFDDRFKSWMTFPFSFFKSLWIIEPNECTDSDEEREGERVRRDFGFKKCLTIEWNERECFVSSKNMWPVDPRHD